MTPQPAPDIRPGVRARIATAHGALGLAVWVGSGVNGGPAFGPGDVLIRAWMLCAATLGGALGGAVTAAAYGRPGARGATIAVLGAAGATLIGGAAGGMLVVPGTRALLGPMIVVLSMRHPGVLLLWIGGMVAIHLMVLRWRRAA